MKTIRLILNLAALLSLVFTPKVRAQLPNAWQITDASTASGGFLNYTNILPAEVQVAATNAGFDFKVNARFVTDYGKGNQTMVMIYGDGTTRWEILWSLDANGDLVAELYGGGNHTYVVTTNGTGTVLYHTHEIIFNPTSQTASYLMDGQVLTTNWTGSAAAWPAGQVAWGAISPAGVGQMNFHTVSFTVTNAAAAAYDAGTSNNPVTAPDPATQGWARNPSAPAPDTSAGPVAADSIGSLPNAWQITDDSTTAGLHYTTNLASAQVIAATNSGFDFTVNARLVAGLGGPQTMTMAYGLGNRRFLVWWNLDTNGDLTADVEGDNTYTLTTNGTGTTFYHTHEIVYNPTNGTASYLFDGQVVASNWPGRVITFPAGEVYWGAGSGAGLGQMNFHTVGFSITNQVVASYDAGMAGNPVVAPDPADFGWVLSSSSPPSGTGANAISPDAALLPVATTLAANHFTADSAQLNGQANPAGSPAEAWFEWGTSLAYGNRTTPQPIGSGTNRVAVASTLPGLVLGANYHFRLVVSNAFAVVVGSDQSFNLENYLPVPGTPDFYTKATNSAVLEGGATPSGLPTWAWFEWGTDTNYGNSTAMQYLGQGSGFTSFSTLVSNLTGGLNYHYQLVASNAVGAVASGDYTFSVLWTSPTLITNLPGVDFGSAAWGDYDNDGHLDILLTGYYGTNEIAQIWHNNGDGTFSNVTVTAAPGLPGVDYSSVAWGDYDNDGRLDFLLTGYDGTNEIAQIWHNQGDGTFSNVTAAAAPGLPGVLFSSVAWGDYDNDGRLDFLLTGDDYYNGSDHYISQIWHNNGNGTFSNVTPTVAPGLPGVDSGSVAWADYDNDGRLDFLLTGADSLGTRITQIWHNNGDSTFSNVTATATSAYSPALPGVTYSSVAWADYDNDGWLDFVLTGANSIGTPITQIWRNNGDGTFSETFDVLPTAPLMPGVEMGSVAWGDFNNDGWLDLLLAGDSNGGNICELWQQTGSGFMPDPTDLPGAFDISVACGDFDNDGRLDLLITGVSTNGLISQLWRNNMSITNAPPAAPSGLSATVAGNNVTLHWTAPADDFTPIAGLSYNVRIGTTPGASDVVSPMALANGQRLLPAPGNAQMGTNAFFANLAPGTYYWSVQALDTSFAGGPFAPEASFTVAMMPVLNIVSSNANAVISWQPSAPGVVLQESPGLSPAAWTNAPSGATNPVVVPVTNQTRFYRLFKP